MALMLMILKAFIFIGAVMGGVAYGSWAERRVFARVQVRSGPNRVGFGILATLPLVGKFLGFTKNYKVTGLGQPIADGLKLFMKEDIEPYGVDKWPYRLAPVLSVLTVLAGFAFVPVGPDVTFGKWIIPLQVSEVPVALLYILGIGSLGAYSTILAGWSSNSKYSLMGGLRAAAQLVSYEMPLGLAVLSVVLLSGSLSLREMVAAQGGGWFVFYQPLAFLIAMTAMIAEANRTPFDMPEAESELVAGFFTEYSGMRYALFMLAEYSHLFLSGCVLTCLFFGGWSIPFVPLESTPWFLGVAAFAVKVIVFILFCMWLRTTVPRFRYDKVMQFTWKYLTPLAALNLVATAILGKLL